MGRRQIFNMLANFAGAAGGLVFPLVFNIAYYRLLGGEGYGLIGFYGSLTLLAALFDMGLGQTAVREVARHAADPERTRDLRSVVLTLQAAICGLGLLLGILVAAGAPWLAASWLKAAHLPTDEVATAIALMGGVLAFSFPVGIFTATLRGLQRHVLSNAFAIVAGACRGTVTVACLYALGATPLVFFSVQLALTVLEAVLLGGIVWRRLPVSPARPRLQLRLVQESWRFTSATWLSAVVGQLTILGDKVILSTLLPLELFGLYSLAFTAVLVLTRLVTPFTSTYFPYFVELLGQGGDQLSRAFALGTQLASAVVVSAGMLMAIYANPIMRLLTGNPQSAETIAPIFAILVAANTVNLLIWLPQARQLAGGIAGIALRINLLQSVLYLPPLAFLVPRFGLYAPALLWLAVSIATFPVFVTMNHRSAFAGETRKWLDEGILRPSLGAAAVLAAGAFILPQPSSLALLPWLGLNYALAVGAAVLCAPDARAFVHARLAQLLR